MEFETLYSPLTPTHKYQEDQLKDLPQKNAIIDLREIMEEYKSPFKDHYEEQIQNLKKDLNSVRQEKQLSESREEEMRIQSTKLENELRELKVAIKSQSNLQESDTKDLERRRKEAEDALAARE